MTKAFAWGNKPSFTWTEKRESCLSAESTEADSEDTAGADRGTDLARWNAQSFTFLKLYILLSVTS